MRYTSQEKLRIINLVRESKLPIRIVLNQMGLNSSTYYKWYSRYRRSGPVGLENIKTTPKRFWNSLSKAERKQAIQIAFTNPEKAPKDIAKEFSEIYGSYISESSVYRILNSFDKFENKKITLIKGRNRFSETAGDTDNIWKTEFVYIRLFGWGFYYLMFIIDDYSKYVIDWKLYTNLTENDPEQLIITALWKTGQKGIRLKHRARLLTGNYSKLFIDRLKEFLYDYDLKNLRGNSSNARVIRKIDGTIQTKKNVINLNNYYLPGNIEEQIKRFIDYYNNECIIKAFSNMTPASIYHKQEGIVQQQREQIKEKTLLMRKIRNLGLEN
ncbi:helix-turn-helix domain-containing protein [bacterium]|nr:helix-turn-helix domain-containing protein [bacterium]MBU1064452.1 helix-turn-helix domain-containing protein [bacterium]MBU1634862.1 helix-turn-helix domain-containing protein [bacterium]MBU1874780.1 helix-turn-helix domain-containing protein [bacterium]